MIFLFQYLYTTIYYYYITEWHVVAQLVEALRCKLEVCGFDSLWCHWNFALMYFLPPHCGAGVDSAFNRNSWGMKAAGA